MHPYEQAARAWPTAVSDGQWAPHCHSARRRDGGPWLELGIKSYYTDPARPWQTRQYRVHGSTWQHVAPS